jgi:antitoxin FitA
MTLILNLPLDLEQRLSHEAERHGITTVDYALQVLKQHLSPTDEEFKKAADYVLSKNAELYRRLA